MRRFHRKDPPDTVTIEAARIRFLDAYAREKPEVLAKLADTVPLWPSGESSIEKTSLRRVRESRPTLADALSGWARKYYLTFQGEAADWVIDTALATLRTWASGAREIVYYPSPGAAPVRQTITKGALPWCHAIEEHEQFPAEPPELPEWARPKPGEELTSSIRIIIAPWKADWRVGASVQKKVLRRVWPCVSRTS
jgi:hypothetical protein